MKIARWAVIATTTAALGLALTLSSVASAGPKGKKGTPAERVERIFSKRDANRDGFLDASEVKAKKWRRLSRADADGDGKVSRKELTAALEARRAKAEARRGERARDDAHGGT